MANVVFLVEAIKPAYDRKMTRMTGKICPDRYDS